MKESSYHDAKMEAYCQEVRRLEDRFDGLELNHIPRRLNEAADMLTKAASGREPIPTWVTVAPRKTLRNQFSTILETLNSPDRLKYQGQGRVVTFG